MRDAIDSPPGVVGVDLIGDPAGVAVGTTAIGGFPMTGPSYLVISSGDASALPGDPATFSSVNLPDAAPGADGFDLTQVKVRMKPPADATCVAFDFAFLSEEYPEYVGSSFNDIFTAELNDSHFEVSNNQVVAPNNFAYDAKGNPVSINTVLGMSAATGTVMDGITPPLTATSPVEKRLDGTMDVILSVQDIGDPIYDSAAIVDNFRFGNGPTCATGATPLQDADGDALPDEWEQHGLDADKDGTVDLDLPAMGATADHKDLFIEVDHMKKAATCIWLICWGGKNFAPQEAALDDVRKAFADSPVTNPDGKTGVRTHIDSGAGSVMNPDNGATWGGRSRASVVPHVGSLGSMSGGDYDWTVFDSLKSANFELARRDVFHYAVYADTYAGSGSSGISRGIPGSDFLVTDGDPGWGAGFTRTQERGTFMHELGHGLALRHGGDIDQNYRPGYNSIMSYAFQLIGLPPDSRLDYSRGAPFVDWEHLRFDGGAVGARGSSTTLPTTTEHDEPSVEELQSQGVFAVDGDGTVSFVGPSVLIPETGASALLFDVSNAGDTADDFTLKVTTADPKVGGQVTVSVDGGQTKRVSIPVNTAGLSPATLTALATLSSTKGGGNISQVSEDIVVANIADPQVRDAARDALAKLKELPADSGLDDALISQLTQALSMITDVATCGGKPATIVGKGSKIVGTSGNDVILGTATAEEIRGNGGHDVICGLGGDDKIDGGGGDDTVYGGPGADTLTGGDGRDSLRGEDADDVLRGGDGRDLLEGGEGNDALEGGNGDDALHGGGGDDVLKGNDDSDVLEGGDGKDSLEGGDNDDTLNGQGGDDTLRGGDGKDTLDGGDGADTARGDAGRDTVKGGTGNDALFGGDGDDRLFGEDGDDVLSGNDGNDALHGGPGTDQLNGGSGKNVLVQ